jgi:hypothetical protein
MKVALDFHTTRRGITRMVVGVTVVVVLTLSLSVYFNLGSAGTTLAAPMGGDCSAPDYGFTY